MHPDQTLEASDAEIDDGGTIIEVHSTRGWFVRITDPADHDPEDRWSERPKVEFVRAPKGSEFYFLEIDGEKFNGKRATC